MTIISEPHDIQIIQGSTFYWPIALDAPDGSTYDLSAEGDGYTVGRMTIRDMYSGELVTPQLTTDNGGLVLTAFTDSSGDWSGYVLISAADTAAMTPWGLGVYDIEIATSSGPSARVERPWHGNATLNLEVST